MPRYRARIHINAYIDIDAENMYSADNDVQNMTRQEIKSLMVIDEIDTDLDQYPEEI